MFSFLQRNSFASLFAILALVFMMTGGALAAKKYLITSTNQISPGVLKKLKGKKGANGVNGTNGAPGAVGKEGPAGPTGKEGPTGPPGATGFTETLPSGKTLSGVWAVPAQMEPAAAQFVPISYGIPLAVAPEKEIFVEKGEETGTGDCPGSVAEPKAKAGVLCIYTQEETGLAAGVGFVKPAPKKGVILKFFTEEFAEVRGSWAVTAK